LTFEHAWALKDLPLHHRDPFDRMLIVQALIERLTVVTADSKFEPYGVDLIRA
jgi:PIN domain nuclease of toxin-antitoxin system